MPVGPNQQFTMKSIILIKTSTRLIPSIHLLPLSSSLPFMSFMSFMIPFHSTQFIQTRKSSI